MRKCQANKLVNKLQFITITKNNNKVITFYIPKDGNITITNLDELLEYNNKYKWITREVTIRDMQKNPNNYSITKHTDEEAYNIVQEFKFYIPEQVKREIAPVRDADGTVVYYNTLSPKTFLLPYSSKTQEHTNKGNT